MAEFVEGLQFVSDLRKQVIVFGAGHIKKDSEYYKSARSLGKRLGKARFEVVTLGGGGVMEAANKGASEANGTSVGLFRMRVGKQKVNPYANKSIGFHYYFTRKVVMAATARVYVFFPGGYGTIDAFFDLITLIQTGKMEKIPIYLMGKEYWSPLLNFIKMEMLQKNNTISPKDIEFFRLVDSVDEVYDYVVISDPRREFLFF